MTIRRWSGLPRLSALIVGLIVSLIAGLTLSLSARAAFALQIHQLDVEQQDGEYRLVAESSIAAPREYVHAILMDFDNFYRLTGGITASRFLIDEATGERLGYTRIDSCVWFFCKGFDRIERISADPPELFSTVAIPERSDFKRYESQWRLTEETGGTRIEFTATMRPSFWIPPIIGAWAVRRKLELTAEQMGAVIEYLYANGLTVADIPEDAFD